VLATVLGVLMLTGPLDEGVSAMETYFNPDAFADGAPRRFATLVTEGRYEEAIAAAADLPAGVNTLGDQNETALLLAVERGRTDGARVLLEAGADPNGGADRAPLVIAVRLPELDAAKLLLSAGADPAGRLGGDTPLHRAAALGRQDAVEMLLSAGASVDQLDRRGTTPALAAAMPDRWRIVLHLLEQGAHLAFADPAGFTVGAVAAFSKLSPSAPDGPALQDVIKRWKDAGLPWPPPTPPQVRELKKTGGWP
jgi:hypothetical protein